MDITFFFFVCVFYNWQIKLELFKPTKFDFYCLLKLQLVSNSEFCEGNASKIWLFCTQRWKIVNSNAFVFRNFKLLLLKFQITSSKPKLIIMVRVAIRIKVKVWLKLLLRLTINISNWNYKFTLLTLMFVSIWLWTFKII